MSFDPSAQPYICRLPWKSLHVNMNGEVVPCCFWDTYGQSGAALGNIYQNSIEEIWNGANYRALRRGIQRDEPTLPCHRCFLRRTAEASDADAAETMETDTEFVETPSFQNLALNHREYQRRAISLRSKPVLISLTSTSKCNIDCTFCFQAPFRLHDVELANDALSKVLDLIPTLTTLFWQGGEFLIDRRFRSFLDSFDPATNPRLGLNVVTNGMLVDIDFVERALKKFARLNISFSIDSFNAPTYERVRRRSKLNRVLKNHKEISDLAQTTPRLSLAAQGCVMKSTLPELADTIGTALTTLTGDYRLSPIMGWPPHEMLSCFNDFARETEGWEDAIAAARRRLAQLAADRPLTNRENPFGIAAVLDYLDQEMQRLKALYQETVEFPVVIAPLPSALFDQDRTLDQWQHDKQGFYVAETWIDCPVPPANLVGARWVVTENGQPLAQAKAMDEFQRPGHFFCSGAAERDQGTRRFIRTVISPKVQGHPQTNGARYALQLQAVAPTDALGHRKEPLLVIFEDATLGRAFAYQPINQPGTYSMAIPRALAGSTLGLLLLEDEVTYFGAARTVPVISHGDDGRPVVAIGLASPAPTDRPVTPS